MYAQELQIHLVSQSVTQQKVDLEDGSLPKIVTCIKCSNGPLRLFNVPTFLVSTYHFFPIKS